MGPIKKDGPQTLPYPRQVLSMVHLRVVRRMAIWAHLVNTGMAFSPTVIGSCGGRDSLSNLSARRRSRVWTERGSGCRMIVDGWFHEEGTLWPGQAMSLEVEEVLLHEKSDFQDVLVMKSKTYGTVLVLDGVIQVTERDEFSYQEMMTHLPMGLHANPRKVLVVGGGDGGVLREVLKYDSVEEVILCEIDKKVIEVSKIYLPSMACAYDDPRVKVMIMDGAEYMRQHQNYFDVIITDSSDPIGPAETLFQAPYYEAIASGLTDDGVLCSQGECMWLHLDIIKPTLKVCQNLFPSVKYAYTCIPTYPSGQIGQIICSKKEMDLTKAINPVCPKDLKYYSRDIHSAAFVLPEFCRKSIEE